MLYIPRLLIVAGSGRHVGKTTAMCRIISSFTSHKLYAVKISSHFHTLQNHLDLMYSADNYTISEERSRETQKDSSLFLQAGAMRSFYIQTQKASAPEAFDKLLELVPHNNPIVCESPSLASSIIPGVLIVITRDGNNHNTDKSLFALEERKALRITTRDIDEGVSLPVTLVESGFLATR